MTRRVQKMEPTAISRAPAKHPEEIAEEISRALGEMVEVRLPSDCDEPILGAATRGTIREWMLEQNAAEELLAVGIKPRQTCLLHGPPGCGKEQPLTAKILTPTGWKLMGEMSVGTPVCGADGRTYHVMGVYPQGVSPAYRVTFTDGTSTEAGANHLWKVKGHHGARDGWVVRSTSQLMAGNSRKRTARNYHIPIPEAVEFAPTGSLPVAPYVLGAIIGDGALTGSCVALSVPVTKEPIRQKVAALLGEDYTMTIHHPNASAPQWNIVGGRRNGSTMRSIVKSLGLAVRSSERFIPAIYKTASVSDRLELLRGLMDSDGTATKGRTSFSTLSATLADDVCELVRSLGGVAISRRYWRGDHFEWNINVRLKECPFSLAYKADGWIAPKFSYGKHIASIDYVGDVEQQCIMVSAPDHLYITDGFNVTHNTTIANHFAARLGMVLVIANGEMIVTSSLGGTGQNIHRFFASLRKYKASVIGFFDEFDSVATARSDHTDACGKEFNSIVTALLTNIERHDGLFFAATNIADGLDAAIWRRFGIHIRVDLPGFDERFAIIKRYLYPFVVPDDTIDGLSLATNGAAPALLRQFCEGIKRALVLAPRMKRDTSDIVEVVRVAASQLAPHPSLVAPPLWCDDRDAASKLIGLPWPPLVGSAR